jgi:hypothetical protein
MKLIYGTTNKAKIEFMRCRIDPLDCLSVQIESGRYYYDIDGYVENNRSDGRFDVSFTKKSYDTPFEYLPDDSDKLFAPWWDDVMAWGIVENGQLIAVIETSVEEWSNRLRINNWPPIIEITQLL